MTAKAIAVAKSHDVAVHDTGANALMSMIERAVSDPTFDVAKMEALLAVKERWEREEARKAFVAALAAFKANPPLVLKSKKVEFKETKYKHATLSDASSIIGASLSQHGISHRWNVNQKEGKIAVTCILTHVLGHSESVTMECAPDQSGSKNAIQSIGSATTYLQRYTLFAASGVASTEADDDGKASGKAPKSEPIPGPKESKTAGPTKGTDTFTVKAPFLFGTGDKIEFRGPAEHQKYRIDTTAAKTAKANFKDGDTAEVAWEIKGGIKHVVDLDRKTSDASAF